MTKLIHVDKNDETLMQEVMNIRKEVFVNEQNCPEDEEWDDSHYNCEYYLVFDDNKAVGTLRWRINNEKIKIERVAVLKEFRGKDFGKQIVEFVLNDIKTMGLPIYLNSQEQVISFYENFGFEKYGERFYEANIPHFAMKLVNK